MNSKAAPIGVDFLAGASRHRRLFSNHKKQNMGKALGVAKGVIPTVIDATAGLGGDSFAMANWGCNVLMLEQSAVVFALLDDGLERFSLAADDEDRSVSSRMQVLNQNAEVSLASCEPAQVVYLDPMYPSEKKSAASKKEMTAFKALLDEPNDGALLLSAAREAAINRVVVKRPKRGEHLAGKKPTMSFEGKTTRFDVYVNAAF